MMHKGKRTQWRDLTPKQKAGAVSLAAAQFALLAAALADIRRRPPSAINGSKRLWVSLAFINWIGPIAYFVFGRKREVVSGVS